MVLGKVAIVIGSGIVGTVLTGGESSLPDFKDVISGAFKFMTKGAKKAKDAPSTSSPHTAHLLTQVNYLREELQMLSKSNHVAIVTVDGRPGPGAYGITAVVIGAIGYLFIRWKAAKRHLAGRIDRVDCSLDECQEITEATRNEVTIIHGDLSAFQKEMETVHLVVRSLETKLGRLAYTQVTSSTPRPAIESSERTARAASPSALEPESPSDQSPRAEAPKPQVVRSTTMSASGLSMLAGTTMPPKRDHQGSFSRASSMKAGSSDLPSGAPSSAEPSPRRSGSSTLFGGFGFLRNYTS
nr:unnamed protein product [Digitaria exilis]